jgi:hypothetical protein
MELGPRADDESRVTDEIHEVCEAGTDIVGNATGYDTIEGRRPKITAPIPEACLARARFSSEVADVGGCGSGPTGIAFRHDIRHGSLLPLSRIRNTATPIGHATAQ